MAFVLRLVEVLEEAMTDSKVAGAELVAECLLMNSALVVV